MVLNNVNWLNWLYFLQSGTRTPATFTVYAGSSVSATVATTIQLRSSKGLPDHPRDAGEFPAVSDIQMEHLPHNPGIYREPGPNPLPAQLTLAWNTTNTFPPEFAASAVSDRNWLQVGGDFATAGGGVQAGVASTISTISVSCRCNQLPPGSYTGVVYVIAGSYDGEAFTVPVTLTVSPPASSGFSAAPPALTFDYQIGGSPPLGQSIAVSASGASTFRTAASNQSGTWLAVTPASAATPATVSVAVNPTGLSPATYTGAVALTPASGSTISIPVTLTVRAAAPIAASVSSLTFTYRAGDAAPPAQTVQISGGGPSPTFTIQVPDSASWLKASPASGNAPAAIAISVDPAKLTPGTYQANLTLTGTGSAVGSLVLAVTLQVTAPLPTVSKVVHAASYAEGSVAPGEMLTLFGTNIGPDSLTGLALDGAGNVATSLGGVQVLFDGMPSPLVYVSKTQIAVVAPYELAGRQDTTVQVSWSGQRSNGITIPVATTAPGIFTANSSGTGPGAIRTRERVHQLPRESGGAGRYSCGLRHRRRSDVAERCHRESHHRVRRAASHPVAGARSCGLD